MAPSVLRNSTKFVKPNSQPLKMDSLTLTGLLKKAASEFPAQRALSVSGKFDLTHARLNHLVDHAASCLLAAGVAPGDVFALTFPNTSEFVVAFLAVIRCRATASLLNLAYTAEEFEFYISNSGAKLLITGNEGNKSAESAASKLRIPRVIATLNDGESELSLSPSPDVTAKSNSFVGISNDPSDVALFLHTSGTTSRPKGVPLTQLNLASSARNIGWAYKFSESDGYLRLVCLIKELTHRGGEKIAPTEVHPYVGQAVLFGVPDDKYGKKVLRAAMIGHDINVSLALEAADVRMTTGISIKGGYDIEAINVVPGEDNSEDVIEVADVEITIGSGTTEGCNIEARDAHPREDNQEGVITVSDLYMKIGPHFVWASGCTLTAIAAAYGLPIFGHRFTPGIYQYLVIALHQGFAQLSWQPRCLDFFQGTSC